MAPATVLWYTNTATKFGANIELLPRLPTPLNTSFKIEVPTSAPVLLRILLSFLSVKPQVLRKVNKHRRAGNVPIRRPCPPPCNMSSVKIGSIACRERSPTPTAPSLKLAILKRESPRQGMQVKLCTTERAWSFTLCVSIRKKSAPRLLQLRTPATERNPQTVLLPRHPNTRVLNSPKKRT